MVANRGAVPARGPSVLVCGALTLNLGLALSYATLWAMLAAQGLFWRADFSSYYTGWYMAREGQTAHLYDLDWQARYQQQILEGRSFADGLLPFIYPPHTVVPFLPLAWLPRATAFWVWTLLQMVLLAWLLRQLWQLARGWEPQERWLLLSAVLAYPPLLWNFQLGAFSLLILACLTQCYLDLQRGRDARAGLWLVGGTLKPQLVLLPAVALLAGRRWRALAAAALAGGALLAVSVLALGAARWPEYAGLIRAVPSLSGQFNFEPTAMINVRALLNLLLGSERAEVVNAGATLALLAAMVGTLLLWRGPWLPRAPAFELRLALTVTLGLLFSPYLFVQDTLLLVLPAALFYSYLRERGLPRRLYALFVLSNPLVFLVADLMVHGSLGIRLPLVMVVGLAGWLAKALWDERRLGGPESPHTLLAQAAVPPDPDAAGSP